MLTRIAFTGILLAALCACSTGDGTSDAVKAGYHLQIGNAYLSKGNFPQALRELLEAERLDPQNPIVQNNLGLAYLVREKFGDAEKHFKRAIEIQEKYTDARNNLGRLYIETGLYKQAIKELEIAAADLTFAEPEKSWSNLGQAYFLAENYPKAKMAFQNSLKNRRGSCFTMNLYGRTLFEMKDYKQAGESLDQAVKLCEKNNLDEPNFYSAMSFYKLGQVEMARARFEEVVQLFPNSLYAKKAKEMLEIIR